MSDNVHHVNRDLVNRWRDGVFAYMSSQPDAMGPEDFLVLLSEIVSYGVVHLVDGFGWGDRRMLFQHLVEMMGALLDIEEFRDSDTVTVGNAAEVAILDAFEEIAKRSWDANEGS